MKVLLFYHEHSCRLIASYKVLSLFLFYLLTLCDHKEFLILHLNLTHGYNIIITLFIKYEASYKIL